MEMQFVRAAIVGSGSSSSTPSMSCALSGTTCATCLAALSDPKGNPNSRANPSMLVQLRHPVDATIHNVLIDCGKTFREAALRVFPRYGVADLSAVILTHEHADACFGLDDLREFNRQDDATGALDVFADRATMLSCHRSFGYLFPCRQPEETEEDENALAARLTGGAGAGRGWNFKATAGATWTATLRWHAMSPLDRTAIALRPRLPPMPPADPSHTVEEAAAERAAEVERRGAWQEANTATWEFAAVPVLHGANYYSNAFLFCCDTNANTAGVPASDDPATPKMFFYCSDVSVVDSALFSRLARAKQALLSEDGRAPPPPADPENDDHATAIPLDTLVLDMLSWNSYYSTHLSAEASIAAAQAIDARNTLFVGMSHNVEHESLVAELAKRGLGDRMTPATDGCLATGEPVE